MASNSYAVGGREMTIGSVLSRAFGAVGSAPLLFFGVSFLLSGLPYAVVGLFSRPAMMAAATTAAAAGVSPLGQVLPILFALMTVWLLLYMAAQATLFRATVSVIEGRPGTLGDYVASAARVMLPLVGLAILMTLAVWIGTILLVVPGIILALMWSVAAPALVIERPGVFGAFGRSRYLTKGARWGIFGLVILVFAIYFVASAALGLGMVATTGIAAGGALAPTPSILNTILSMVLQTGFVAVWTTIQASLYVELRDWKDGPAGERLADVFA